MMEVFLSDVAELQMQEIAESYAAEEPGLAAAWFDGLQAALTSLTDYPESYPFARESEVLRIQLRQLLYGLGKRKTHRILFVVRSDQIVVHAIRHVAQQDIDLL